MLRLTSQYEYLQKHHKTLANAMVVFFALGLACFVLYYFTKQQNAIYVCVLALVIVAAINVTGAFLDMKETAAKLANSPTSLKQPDPTVQSTNSMVCFVAFTDLSQKMQLYESATAKIEGRKFIVINKDTIPVQNLDIATITKLYIETDLGIAKELNITFTTGDITLQPMEENKDYLAQYENSIEGMYSALYAHPALPGSLKNPVSPMV